MGTLEQRTLSGTWGSNPVFLFVRRRVPHVPVLSRAPALEPLPAREEDAPIVASLAAAGPVGSWGDLQCPASTQDMSQ